MYTIYISYQKKSWLFIPIQLCYCYIQGSGSRLYTSSGFGTVSAYDNDLKNCNTVYLIKCENYKTVAFDYVNNGF